MLAVDDDLAVARVEIISHSWEVSAMERTQTAEFLDVCTNLLQKVLQLHVFY